MFPSALNLIFHFLFFKILERGNKVLLITKLPRYNDDCYTENELAELLIPFGFKYTHENIYVVPQRQMVSTALMLEAFDQTDFSHN